MSLRAALDALPDDRDTVAAAREVVAFLGEHPDEPIQPDRITRATGVSRRRVDAITAALAHGYVVDCGGDSVGSTYTFHPTPMLALEVRRFLRVSTGQESRLRRGTQRFRDRYGAR